MAKITLPSVLAYEKKLVPSNGIMFASKWGNKIENNVPLKIIAKSIKGTISNRLKKGDATDPAKLDKMIQNANLQIVDACNLPIGFDTLHMFFTLKVLGNIKTPSSCNDKAFLKRYEKLIDTFQSEIGFDELGLRYAINIANGRFLWRNRVGTDAIEIHVKEERKGKEWIFNAFDFSIRNFDSDNKDVKELGKMIASALASDSDFLNLKIDAYVKMGEAQDVYPSEELVLDKSSSSSNKGKKSKILFSIDGVAGMHSQKIGNALRTIDTWFDEYEELNTPIAIETYGSVTNLGRAYRSPATKIDFYTVFDKATGNSVFNNTEEANYSIAMIIRGGVFGEVSK
jgi:CRISPR-associated protein Csy3